MRYPFFYTRRSCRQRQALSLDLRHRVDRLIVGLRLVPTVGEFDAASNTYRAHVGREVRVVYRITPLREELVVLDVERLGQ